MMLQWSGLNGSRTNHDKTVADISASSGERYPLPQTARPLPSYLKTPVWAALHRSGDNGDAASPDTDVVLASRARLARNLVGFPFPSRASERDLRRVAQAVRQAARADTERLADLSLIAIAVLSAQDRAELIDARRISPELAEGGASRYALLDDTGHLSLFINEEDHVRLQTLVAGNAPLRALRSVEDAETRLARRLHFARDRERWGYLTSSLGNVGTGLRLSVLIHLPALAFTGGLSATLEAAHILGSAIRGAHGESSAATGDLYQVSNAVSFGSTPTTLVGRVRALSDHLIAAERAARGEIVGSSRALKKVEDGARSAWQRIETADRLEAGDALRLLSSLRLAAGCELLSAPDALLFSELVADLRTGAGLPGNVQTPSAVRDAIQRPARIRSALRRSRP